VSEGHEAEGPVAMNFSSSRPHRKTMRRPRGFGNNTFIEQAGCSMMVFFIVVPSFQAFYRGIGFTITTSWFVSIVTGATLGLLLFALPYVGSWLNERKTRRDNLKNKDNQ
jgi:hypothetical protein